MTFKIRLESLGLIQQNLSHSFLGHCRHNHAARNRLYTPCNHYENASTPSTHRWRGGGVWKHSQPNIIELKDCSILCENAWLPWLHRLGPIWALSWPIWAPGAPGGLWLKLAHLYHFKKVCNIPVGISGWLVNGDEWMNGWTNKHTQRQLFSKGYVIRE